MNIYEPLNIRNIALLGHAGSGKTTLSESILFESGSITRRGTVEEKSTQSDHTEIEQERGCSIYLTPLFAEFKNTKINILEAPGYTDYFGESVAAISTADVSFIVFNAQNKIEVGAENCWEETVKTKKPVVFIINKLDLDQAKFDDTVQDIRDSYGKSATIFQYPVKTGAGFNAIIDVFRNKLFTYPTGGGKAQEADIPDSEKSKAEKLRSELIESIAETDEALMANYFENGELTDDEIKVGLKRAIINRLIFPIFASAGKANIGIDSILNFIIDFIPSPAEMPFAKSKDGKEVACSVSSPVSVFVFKLSSEAHLGDMTFFKMFSGKLNEGTDLYNEQKSTVDRFNQLFITCGKKRIEVPTLCAGDIGSTVKLKSTQINHTLHDKNLSVEFPEIVFPNPRVRVAIVPKTKGEEEKVGMGLHALCLEDHSLKLEHSQELRQMILYSQGELHQAV